MNRSNGFQRNSDSRGGSGNSRGGFGNSRGGFGNSRGGFRRNNNFNSGPREMHKATCTECKQECEVPFKPTEGRDVFCKECFAKKNPRQF